MSVSDKPWLADRQPSLRGGVLQVTTGPCTAPAARGKREAHRGRNGRQAMTAASSTVWAVTWRFHGRATGASRRHIDLLRCSSARCRR